MRRLSLRMAVFCVVVLAGWISPTAAYNFTSITSWSVKRAGTSVDMSKFQSVDDGAGLAANTGTVLVHVWATWCGPCVAELPAFNNFAERMEKRGIPVVALSVDHGGLNDVKPFMAKHPSFAHTHVLLDPTYLSGEQWGIRILPTTLLIKEGREVARLIGKGDWDGDEGEELTALLSQLKGQDLK